MEAHLGKLWDLGVKEPHQLATLEWEDVEDTGMKKFEVGWEQPHSTTVVDPSFVLPTPSAAPPPPSVPTST